MSKPINAKITDVLYIDDLKVYAQSESKLSCVLKNTNSCMNDIGLQLSPKKCNVIHMKRGEIKQGMPGIKVSDTVVVQPLEEDRSTVQVSGNSTECTSGREENVGVC